MFEERLKDPVAKALFQELTAQQENISIGKKATFLDLLNSKLIIVPDNLNFYYLKLLQAILSPSMSVEQKKYVKYSIADSQKSFTQEVYQASDIDLQSQTQPQQPILFAIGQKFMFQQFVVLLGGSKFLFNTYLEAIEFCFQVISIFKFKYIKKCENIWLFLQNFCFEAALKSKNSKVETFISDVNNLIETIS